MNENSKWRQKTQTKVLQADQNDLPLPGNFCIQQKLPNSAKKNHIQHKITVFSKKLSYSAEYSHFQEKKLYSAENHSAENGRKNSYPA